MDIALFAQGQICYALKVLEQFVALGENKRDLTIPDIACLHYGFKCNVCFFHIVVNSIYMFAKVQNILGKVVFIVYKMQESY